MYKKNLTEDLRLRLSTKDMDFLRKLSDERATSISEVIRTILAEYRRSCEMMSALSNAIQLANKEEGLSDGDTKTDKHDKL